MVRILIFGCCLLFLLASCGDRRKNANPFDVLAEQIDSANAVSSDSVCDLAFGEEETVPVAADESFADFFYNFASDEGF